MTRDPHTGIIHLVGPGAAGKTTTGTALAAHLGLPFVDLDAAFTAHHGSITGYLDRHGYPAYAGRNVEIYLRLVQEARSRCILALSSGFMTYPDGVHPAYANGRLRILSSGSTFVLLPSLEEESCVRETVRRQLQRPFARTPEREEQVIRERFRAYANLPVPKIETMRPIHSIVADLVRLIPEGAPTPEGLNAD